MAELTTFGQNIYLLIGILLLLRFGSVVAVVVWTGLRAFVSAMQQRQSKQAYRQRTRRADGKMYPPSASGVCKSCGRVSKIYFTETDEELCAWCYEVWWRQAEASENSDRETAARR